MEWADIAIMGGTGIYDPKLLDKAKQINISTPYGPPSDMITVGEYGRRRVAILPRHGKNHSLPPHKINYRANIWALKQLGVKQIISPCAVGSLQDDVHPGTIVLVDQFIDRTNGRLSTFYEGGKVCHISVADPVCPEMKRIAAESTKKCGLKFRGSGTYVCIQGPRFSTRAESRLYRNWGAHVIGMTMVPECVLAREAEICYLSLATVTDYDTFKENSVDIKAILKAVKDNEENIKRLITDMTPKLPEERACPCKDALSDAFV